MLDYYWVISRKKYTYRRVCIPFGMLPLESNVQILGTILKIALKLEKLILQATKPPYNVKTIQNSKFKIQNSKIGHD